MDTRNGRKRTSFHVLSLVFLSLCLITVGSSWLTAQDKPAPTPSAAPSAIGVVSLSQLDLANYPTITAYLSITDPEDKPINLIHIKDLTVTEENKPVGDLKVLEADPVTDPLSIVLAVDVSGSMAGEPLTEAKRAAEEFVNLLGAGDKAALVTFDQDVYKNVGLTDDKQALITAIRGLVYKGDTALYQAVIDSAAVLKDVPAGRRIVVILTDGVNDKPKTPATKEESVVAAGDARAVVITVGLGKSINTNVLKYIADETGGRFFFVPGPKDLKSIYTLISEQIHAQYKISFTSPFPERPDRVVLMHTIRVGLRYGGEEVTGERKFLASTNPPPNTGALMGFAKKEKGQEIWMNVVYALGIIGIALVIIILLVLIARAARARR